MDKHWRHAYGLSWAPLKIGSEVVPLPDWMIHRDLALGRHGCESIPGFQGRAWHFMRFCDTFFSDENGLFYMEWNPNAVKIVEEFFANKMLAIMGAASSGKSFALACIAVGVYLLDPRNTKVLVTSTTVQTAKGKIWGDISYAWDQVCSVYKKWGVPPPGKKLTGDPIIRYECDGTISHKAGLELVPTQQSTEKQSMEKVQGYKNENVVFLGDEWDTLGHGLINTVHGNLKSNPNSRCIAAFNPTGRTTPGGKLAKPKGGWEVINEDSTEWETDFGKCIRFDARKSPNVLAGRKLWKGLPTIEDMVNYETLYGENKPLSWWSMVAAWFPPTGEATSIYSEAELLIQYHADHPVTTWLEDPVKIAGFDPGFAHDGDSSMFVVGQVGLAQINGRSIKVCERVDTINIDREIIDKKMDKSEQVVKIVANLMDKHGIDVRNLAVDVSGAGAFSSLITREIGSGFIGATFNNKPTEMSISKTDRRKAKDVYEDLVSELWYSGKPLIREGQLKGIDADTIDEMCQRSYMGGGKAKIKVEPKKLMKRRLHKSPDRSDAYFLMVHVARMRHGLSSAEDSANNRLGNHPLTELGKFYEANPHMLPPKPSRWKKREKYEQLENQHVKW